LDSNRKAQFHNVLSEPGYRNEFIAEKSKIYKKIKVGLLKKKKKFPSFLPYRERERDIERQTETEGDRRNIYGN
jgi:hypothetical protein